MKHWTPVKNAPHLVRQGAYIKLNNHPRLNTGTDRISFSNATGLLYVCTRTPCAGVTAPAEQLSLVNNYGLPFAQKIDIMFCANLYGVQFMVSTCLCPKEKP